jgi:hypothetical protein
MKRQFQILKKITILYNFHEIQKYNDKNLKRNKIKAIKNSFLYIFSLFFSFIPFKRTNIWELLVVKRERMGVKRERMGVKRERMGVKREKIFIFLFI